MICAMFAPLATTRSGEVVNKWNSWGNRNLQRSALALAIATAYGGLHAQTIGPGNLTFILHTSGTTTVVGGTSFSGGASEPAVDVRNAGTVLIFDPAAGPSPGNISLFSSIVQGATLNAQDGALVRNVGNGGISITTGAGGIGSPALRADGGSRIELTGATVVSNGNVQLQGGGTLGSYGLYALNGSSIILTGGSISTTGSVGHGASVDTGATASLTNVSVLTQANAFALGSE